LVVGRPVVRGPEAPIGTAIEIHLKEKTETRETLKFKTIKKITIVLYFNLFVHRPFASMLTISDFGLTFPWICRKRNNKKNKPYTKNYITSIDTVCPEVYIIKLATTAAATIVIVIRPSPHHRHDRGLVFYILNDLFTRIN